MVDMLHHLGLGLLGLLHNGDIGTVSILVNVLVLVRGCLVDSNVSSALAAPTATKTNTKCDATDNDPDDDHRG